MDARVPARWGFLAGLLGGMASAAIMLAIRLVFGIPAFIEVLVDRVVPLVPVVFFSFAVNSFGSFAKQILFASVLVGLIITSGIVGMLYAQIWGRNGLYWANVDSEVRKGWVWRAVPWRSVMLFASLLYVLIALVLYPIMGAGLLGAGLRLGIPSVPIALAAALFAYAIVTAITYGALASPPQAELVTPPDPTRRLVMRRIALGGLAVVLGGTLVGLLAALRRGAAEAFVYKRDLSKLTPELTSNEDFYVVSKNFADPQVGIPTWKLEVTGLVERPFAIGYSELLAYPATEQYQTLECISNPIGGNLMSTARWRGVALRELLSQAGLKPGVVDIALFAEDEYSDSIPLDAALAASTLLAFEMNGESLPGRHGSPVRLLVPGHYGEKNIKWLKRIEAVNYDFKGYWQRIGWSDDGDVRLTSRIDLPSDGALLALQLNTIGGVSYAGTRGIKRVELSLDGGVTWMEAVLKPALGPFTWVVWTYDWQPMSAGEYKIVVRAFDSSGAVQTAVTTDNFPDGPTGRHTVTVRVLAS